MLDKNKFRGIRTDIKEWIYGDLVHDTIDSWSKIIEVGIKKPQCYPIEVFKNSVGQFVGVKDIEEKEVYEYDLCEIAIDYPNSRFAKGRRFVIGYTSNKIHGTGFQGKFIDEEEYSILLTPDFKFRIIGNTYEL